MNKPTRTMWEVCEQFFDGNWQAMIDFAQSYDPDERDRTVELGKRFRDIIGTRNRSEFWKSVTKCDAPFESGAVVVDGDSLCGIQRAIRLCAEGTAVKIELDGSIIGKLVPESHADESAGGKQYDLFGHRVTAVIRWMGKQGWDFAKARRVLDVKSLHQVADATVRTQLSAGKHGGRGEPAPLTESQAAELESLS